MLCPHYVHWAYSVHPDDPARSLVACRLCDLAAREADEALAPPVIPPTTLFACDDDVAVHAPPTRPPRPPPFDRHRVRQMVCSFCRCAQPAAAACVNPECTHAGKAHAYYCDVCHLWEHDPHRQIFHCEACGLCRVGDPAAYRHCDACGLCVPAVHPRPDWDTSERPPAPAHRCVGGKAADNPCPVCYEGLAESTDPVTFLRCGHALHQSCLVAWVQQGGGWNGCMVCRG